MSTKHSKAAEKFLQDSKMAAWHNETLWMVRAKRDKMSKEVPEWEELRNKACELKLYSNSHLEELLLEFEKNATANGAIVHWAKDADEYCAIVYEILNEHNVHHFIKSKSMLAEECGLNPFLMERGIDVVESDLGERILQLMHLEPSHIVLPAIHIKRLLKPMCWAISEIFMSDSFKSLAPASRRIFLISSMGESPVTVFTFL